MAPTACWSFPATSAVGRAVPASSRIYVATKLQPVVWPDSDDDQPQMRGRYPRRYLRAGVDAALRQLRTDRIDLLQLHSWIPTGLYELDWLEALNELRVEGKVDHIGVSLRDYRPDEGIDLARLGLTESIQVVFNLFEQRPADRQFPAGAATNTAYIARVPLDSGSLIGHWTPQTYDRWEPGSVPHTLFRGDRFAQTLQRAEELKKAAPLLPDAGRSRAALHPQLT